MADHDTPGPPQHVPGGGGRGLGIRDSPWVGRGASRWHRAPGPPGRLALPMNWPASWWWPNRPPGFRRPTAGLLAGLGAVLFGVSALLITTGATSWDARLFRILNQVPGAAASALTPLSHLFLPAGIIAVVLLTVVYVVARNRSVLPVAAGAVSAGTAWVLANAAKAIADRPRPYEVIAGAVLRQHPAHGTSFPSSHTAVTLAVAIAPCRSWPERWPQRGSATPSWLAGPGSTWGCTIPLTSWPELASGWPPEVGSCWRSGCCSATQAGQRTATTPRRCPGPGPGPGPHGGP